MSELPSRLPIEFEEDEETSHEEVEKIKRFPKKIGIVFAEKLPKRKSLNFDQRACAHLLLQMNSAQRIFDYQVISHDYEEKYFSDPPADDDDDRFFQWFDDEIGKFDNSVDGAAYGIDYWICITSINLRYNRFVRSQKRENGKSNMIFWIMTTNVWERQNTPPSLFEYVTITVLMCNLNQLSNEFNGLLRFHKPLKSKGCIFDFTVVKEHRRIIVSNPFLCNICKGRLKALEKNILDKTGLSMDFYNDIQNVLSRRWMGSLKKVNSPIFNLKRNYGYDVDRNSGFYKSAWENTRDSFKDNIAQWTILALFTVAGGLIVNYLSAIYHWKP